MDGTSERQVTRGDYEGLLSEYGFRFFSFVHGEPEISWLNDVKDIEIGYRKNPAGDFTLYARNLHEGHTYFLDEHVPPTFASMYECTLWYLVRLGPFHQKPAVPSKPKKPCEC
jgi:hypothetical protein